MPRIQALLGLCLLLQLPATTRAAAPPPAQGTRGMVATDHPLASDAGLAILRAGGNAVDAACAAAFALGVVNPAGSGIGGGGFMLIKRPSVDVPVVLDFRETAPAAASPGMYLDKSKRASRAGGLAVAVPGEVAGCDEAIRRFGKLPLRRVLAPAIRLARGGFPVGYHLAGAIAARAKQIQRSPGLSRMFTNKGRPLRAGQRARRPRLARALSAIARQGPAVFYRGWIARDIVRSVKATGGILALEDLQRYRVKERKPLRTSYRNQEIYSMPPPSSGGIALIETLNILSGYKLGKLGHNSSRYLHPVVEALKHAFADRARHLGDTDFVEVPVARLTSRDYAAKLFGRLTEKVLPLKSYGSGEPLRAPTSDGGTSHLSVVDAKGNAVAMTTTINTGFGSLVVAERSGIILNNEMDDFAARPGKPNAFGLIQSDKNAVAPGKRPLSSMSPTIVTHFGKPVLVLGASGGPTIITGTLQVLLNVVDFEMDVSEAIYRPRIHHQWLPDRLWVEDELPRDVLRGLKRRGHRIKRPPLPVRAAVQAVQIKDEQLLGASDPRKGGSPAGW